MDTLTKSCSPAIVITANGETHAAVLLMNHLWILRLREVSIWLNAVLILTSLKTQTARSARGPTLQEPRAEEALAGTSVFRAENFSVKIVNLETITDMQSWCRTEPPNGSSRIRAKQKLLRKHTGACNSSWSRIGSLKSFTLTISWNMAKPVKIFPGIVVRRHHTYRKQMGLLREQCAEWKKAPLQYCCNQVWMKNVGQIPWNASVISEMFKTSWQMGKHRTNGFSEAISWPGHSVWSNGRISSCLCERHRDCISLGQSSCCFFSLDMITADHNVLNGGSESRHNHCYSIVEQDLATQWIQSYPCRTKLRKQKWAYNSSLSQRGKPKSFIYTDNSLEFGKACEDLSWSHCTSTPHRSEANGITERVLRRVKEGTSAVLLQSGLDEKWWADSLECYTFLWHIQDLLSDGKTPSERRFELPFNGPIIPFGSIVEYHPISAKDQWRIHHFGKKVLPGLFLRYALYAEGIWKGDMLVADIEQLDTMVGSEIYSKRLDAKEVIFPKENGKFIFPAADGRIKFVGGYQELRASTLIRDHPIRGEGQRDFLGESEGSPPPPPQDSFPDAGEARNDFWSMSGNFIYRHHVEPRVKLYSPREESFLFHWNTLTSPELLLQIDDSWIIDGSRDLSDSWTGFTQFNPLGEKPPEGHMWSRGETDKTAVN